MTPLIIAVLGGIVCGAAGALTIAMAGHRWGLTDFPNERSSHAMPTPRGGGIGIAAAFLGYAFYAGTPWFLTWTAAAVALFSFLTDREELSQGTRLRIHFLAAFVFLFGYSGWGTGGMEKLAWIIPAAVFIVASANTYNFMDGINGLAGVTGVVAFSLLGTMVYSRDMSNAFLAWSIAAACAGFLPFNLFRARVFMGDAGSILLGFLFASLAVLFSGPPADFICAVLFLFPFYADGLMTMFLRWRKGDSLFKAHRTHLYQLLANERHIAHWKISFLYAGVQLAIGTVALSLRPKGTLEELILLVISSFAAPLLYFRVRRGGKSLQDGHQ